MPPWRLREFHDDDLDQAISIWDQSRATDEPHPVFPISEVVSAARSGQPSVGAVVGDQLVGAAIAQVQGELGSGAGLHRRGGRDCRLPVRSSLRSRPRRHQRTAQADSGVSPARRTAADLRDELGAIAGLFLRPGRFDYIIPIGPPDAAARAAIWGRYLGPTADSVDVDRLVDASEMFTPADIEFAARKGAQSAFEREIEFRRGEPACTETTCRPSPTPVRR